ncbi:inositol monophosphatase family protein [Reyranella soli]|uniref:Inositol phosphatase n=1 Tax=Reyranella soli TaxID=1230389 RepID=A0A512N3K2_9HYPH|nr:inositol monophosphatase family protein [Reyranella soli]GEP53554.1 inositol phosphatase [Reyranella soli]
MLGSADAERVGELMRETAAAELLPRFRSLAKEDIRLKGPGDYVTVADVASEQRLASGLARILPGVPVVGEEAVEKEPDLVDLIARPGESCWVVDPLDGTANFASGKDRFAIIVCLVRDTVAVGGWILDLPTGRMAMALKGEGVTLDGAPVRRPEPVRPPIGFVGYKVKKEFDRQLPADKRSSLGRVSTLNCAGAEYHEILAGRADFNLYRMTKSWDHAAGTLMIAEAGGEAQRFDGKPYAPAQPINSGLIAAIRPQTLAQVRTLFEAVRMPLLAGLPKI